MPLSALFTASLGAPKKKSATTYCTDCEFGVDAVGGGVVFLRESRTIETKAAKTIAVAAMNA